MFKKLFGGWKRKVVSENGELNQIEAESSRTKHGHNSTEAVSRNKCIKASRILDEDLEVRVVDIPLCTPAFFDVSVDSGVTILQVNANHVFSKRIADTITPEKREALEVCLAAWARMERECTNEKKLAQIQTIRKDWGQLLDDYLDVVEEEYL